MITSNTAPSIMPEATKKKILYDALTQDKLELILFPTEQCNFRCTYCYEDFKIKKMPESVIAGIKNLLLQRAPKLKVLHLSWFGGEPLAAYDVVKDISALASELGNQYGFKSVGSMTTNGYTLTESRFLELDKYGVEKIQISLDGDEETHNKTRLRADGAGTFARIWQNLLKFNTLFESGMINNSRIILRLHVHPENINSVTSLAKSIRNSLNPNCFSVHVKGIGHYGGKNDNSFSIFDENSETLQIHEDLIYGILQEYHQEFSEEEVYVCYASKANSFIIRGDGRIGKCTVALNSDANTIGSIAADGKLLLDDKKFSAWLHPLSSLDRGDLGCPITRLPNPDHVKAG